MVLKSLLRKSFLISGIISLLHSCNKPTSSDYPEEASCEMYAGKYEMHDPNSNISYNLVVECNPFNSPETNSFDSVTFYNFANLFNVDNRIDGNKVLDGDNIQPLKDKFGIFSNR
ncbi:MAG: hypothetical protein ACI857_002325 [Arenicella sp.]|jgi:hypothetical protein